MCEQHSESGQVYRFIIYLVMMILCIVYLAAVTAIALKYGPSSRPLHLQIPQLAIELDLTTEGHPVLSFANMTIFHFINRKEHLNITIWYVEALFLYRGIPVTCLLDSRPLKLTGQSEATGEMKAMSCDRDGKYTHGAPFPYTKDMTIEAQQTGRLHMGTTLSIHAVYSHPPLGYWEVLYRPACSEFEIIVSKRGKVSNSNNNIDDKDLFVGIGTLSCAIADPLWVK